MNKEKLNEVLNDKEFVEALLKLDTPEEVQKALKDKGIDISIEVIQETHDILIRYANGQLSEKELAIINSYQNSEGELNDEDLENVSGGVFVVATLSLVATLLGHYGVLAAVASWAGIVGGTLAAGAAATEVGTKGRW